MASERITLLVTHPHPCSYLSGQEATTAFVDPATPIDRHLFTRLAERGFRRSGEHLYQPRCENCQACIPLRVPVEAFTPHRNQQRCWKRNRDLHIAPIASIDTTAIYQLYARYIRARHADGDMYPPDREQFRSFLCVPWPDTEYLGVYAGERLLGVAVTDRLDNGLSAVYTFFDPEEDKRSLGVYGILAQIERARSLGLPYLYLGFWVRDCHKMSYKIDYRPVEMLVNARWQLLR